MRNAYNNLVGKPEGKRPLGIPRGKNIRMDLREMGLKCLGWIHLAQDRDQWRVLVNVAMNHWVPYQGGNFLIS
jgi:hypothetical protein